MQFLKSQAQEHNLQCQNVSKNMLWGWTFKTFKTSRNWGYLIKRTPVSKVLKGITATTLDNNLTHIHTHTHIFYITTVKYNNPVTCILQWKKNSTTNNDSKFLTKKDYHKESPITSSCCIFSSITHSTNLENRKPNGTKCTLKQFRHSLICTKQINHAYLV